MRILVTIPHYFRPQGEGPYSSLSSDPQLRGASLTACITAWHQLFGKAQGLLEHARRQIVPANQVQGYDLDIVVCTTRGQHLLEHLSLAPGLWHHHTTDVEPTLLGFECQAVLRDALGRYDYYCYLEDDLVLHDPWFFRKLAWFNLEVGNDSLLQPHRYEVGANALLHKLFLDGDLAPAVTEPFQNVHHQPVISGDFLEVPVHFVRTLNPHSGCYFLNAEQMAHWAGQPYFLDRDTRFVGPLESAATLGIMRTFRVYKPAAEIADFLAIQHHDTKHLLAVGRLLPLAEELTQELQGQVVAPALWMHRKP